ncbi:prepilin-type N-terminal cleavage/methylation domain-containing protein [uncultured Desulfuromonas sp.]|uniref:type IV pilus modification PilV family protein n=2 Tax=Desulfuromonas TaxID=890 RepID=UPI00261028A2|nr:prepilin-type N-terminal cleavage/methylation domain-containing protein [uncultured Desulfuromonas sp.]
MPDKLWGKGNGSGRKPFSHEMKGFTLVEMMIALFILSVSILGLTAATLTVMRTNLDNDVRNAAVRLTKELAEDLFAADFEASSLTETTTTTESGTVTTPHSATRLVRLRGAEKSFSLSWEVNAKTNDLKEVEITVSSQLGDKTIENKSAIYKHRAL